MASMPIAKARTAPQRTLAPDTAVAKSEAPKGPRNSDDFPELISRIQWSNAVSPGLLPEICFFDSWVCGDLRR
jgi:hypothetical protein